MNAKRRILSIMLALSLLVNPAVPWKQDTILAETTQTFIVDDATLYAQLVAIANWANNRGAVCDSDPDTQTITLEPSNIKYLPITGADMTTGNSREILESLFRASANLRQLELTSCNLSGIDFSALNGNSLTSLTLKRCDLEESNFSSFNCSTLTSLSLASCEMDEPDTVLATLFTSCSSLTSLTVSGINLNGFDFSPLNGMNLTSLCLVSCSMVQVPAMSLASLSSMCLSRNNFSGDGACDNLNNTNFPALTSLYLDSDSISDIHFIENLSPLNTLSLGDDRLTDDSLEPLLNPNGGLAASLQQLNLGIRVHEVCNFDTGTSSGNNSINKFDDVVQLARLLDVFENLKKLELSGLRITSLADFSGIGDDITINFQKNPIIDFAGLEEKSKVDLNYLNIPLSGNFAPGRASELPELLKRILDPEDALRGTLTCTDCSLSEDGTKIEFSSSATSEASVRIYGAGKLWGSTIRFLLKKNPDYNIPDGLTANPGDTLADVPLPDGFTWEDSSLSVGAAGTNTFTAIYTPADTDTYIIVDDIDVSVTVQKRIPSYTIPQGLTAFVGDTLASVLLPDGFSWKDSSLSVGAAGTNTFTAIYTPADTDTYIIVDDIDVPVTVQKRVPSYTIPQGLTAFVGDTLASVLLPDGFSWKNPSLSVGAAGTNTFTAIYTPADMDTYKTVEAAVLVTVRNPEPTPQPDPKPDESHLTGNQIEKRTDLPLMLSTGKQKGSRSINLTWNKVKGCSGYEVYWSYCDGKQNYKKLKTVKSTGKRSCTHKKLKKDRAYKYYVVSYQIKDGKKTYLTKSPVIHVAMKNEKHTNAKRIKTNKSKVVLKVKKTFQIKATAVTENKKKKLLNHTSKFRYYTDNKEVASVTKKGKIKAKKKGTCTIYVIANNGVAKAIKVTVKAC